MGTPLNKTLEKIDDVITHNSKMGPHDWPTFKTYVLINALGGKFEYMQSQVHAVANDPGFLVNTVVTWIMQESDLIKCCAEGGKRPSALISYTNRHECSPLLCMHCKRTSHMADFCISCGGKFAGHSLEEARIAQCNTLANNRMQNNPLPSANIAISKIKDISRPSSPAPSTATSTTISTTTSKTVIINGVAYSPLPTTDLVNITLMPIIDPNFPFSAFHTESQGPSHTSIDWNQFSRLVNTTCDDSFLSTYSTSQLHGHIPNDSPFVLDSGASCHISPERSDFKSLSPIMPHPITGFGGSYIYASRVGTIELCTEAGKKITLNHVLFVPNSTVCLISVFSLNNDGPNTCYFDTTSCSILDSSGKMLLKGRAWVQRHLYILDCTPQVVTPCTSVNIAHDTPSSALYASRTPNLETWHRRLGHCSNRTIIDMACGGIVEGMPINLSSAPATYDHCILGKQTRSHMPRMHEGRQATKQLERVFIDLCRLMPCVSKYGHLYSMNVIDDFSSYVWSLPLKSKSKAINVLCAWHCAVDNQTGEKLKVIVTDNGKLVSKTTTAWCALYSIDHQLTVPHTLAQNGQAE